MDSLQLQIGLFALQLPAWCPLLLSGRHYHCQIYCQTLHKLQSSKGLSRGKYASIHPTKYPLAHGMSVGALVASRRHSRVLALIEVVRLPNCLCRRPFPTRTCERIASSF